MAGDDFEWAAQLMERRREVYERYAPVFWRPTPGITEFHAAFLRHLVEEASAVGVRTDHGFLIATRAGERHDVDDFAVDDDHRWATDGPALLDALPAPRAARVVTARRDEPKRSMLAGLGMVATCRWWVKELDPPTPAEPGFAEVDLGVTKAVLLDAPPVYAPGGPVCMLGDVPPDVAVAACAPARERGAVLAIVTRDTSPRPAPPAELDLEAAGFDNVSEFFEGGLDLPQ